MQLATITLTAVNSAVSDVADAVTSALGTNIPIALGVAALILGSILVWKFFKRMVKS